MARVESPLDRAWRDERARIVGSLARRFGDLTLAEDATQEAFLAASTRWPVDGTPDRPGAWLQTTAYRKAIGMIRRQRPTADLSADRTAAEPTASDDLVSPVDGPANASDDDLFALVLTCCHPALAPEARVALTLRHVCGLDVAETAAAFVVPEPTMAKRLVRAREKIRRAGITFDPPTDAALDERVDDVRSVIYLVFNEGYLSSDDPEPVRTDLCDEAIWLTRHLHSLRADDETSGLLALMLLQHSRRNARIDAIGRLIPLADQDRTAWDHDAIDEARRLLADSTSTTLGAYRVEAAIALLHVSGDAPDWSRIADLYTVLGRIAPSPIVAVHHAFAVGMSDGAPNGLALLEPVIDDGRLAGYTPLHAVHAELLERNGDRAAARTAWRLAASTSTSPSQSVALLARAGA
jgi:RNA polymerase sigma-70 factor, ECF subfamily